VDAALPVAARAAGASVYETVAGHFAAEGVSTVFALMGDGNMHWALAMRDAHGARIVHVRHEHTAVAAAMGWHSATGEVGVASVTCGPGLTQVMTALVSAVRGRVPLVVFAGEAPLAARYYHQRIDQAPFVAACGAHYIAAHEPGLMGHHVREAFYLARRHRRPVVLGIPYDLQKAPATGERYEPSTAFLPALPPAQPDPGQIAEIAGLLRSAERPILIGGRGALASGAAPVIATLAGATGALLANTLPARGLFDADPFSLGVAGGYKLPDLAPIFGAADLVVAFGASLGTFALGGGKLFPGARVVKIGLESEGLVNGLRSGDVHLVADARLAAEALLAEVARGPAPRGAQRDEATARRIAAAELTAEEQVAPGTLHLVAMFRELATVIPKDWDVVCGTGHHAYYHTTMRGYDPARYHHMRDFGAVGNSLPQALGVAAARGDGRVVLFEGDGSLLMYAQELETLRRSGLKLLVVCSNDGGFGAEFHKLRAEGLPEDIATFGRTRIDAIARGNGLAGVRVTEADRFADLFADYEAGEIATVWDVQVSEQVLNPSMRSNIAAGHGTARAHAAPPR
jgi:acetolactate synthase-1/2/3 large subunit